MEGTPRVRLLGAVQVERDGNPVRGFRSRKALALLGYLATQDQPISRERLVDLLWEDKTESQGRNNLSWVLNKISSLLPDVLQTDRHSVQFRPTVPYWLDTEAFKELEAKGDPVSLSSAVELYRGEFLDGLYFEGCAEFELWVVGEREQWRQRAVDALWALIFHHDSRGEYELSLRYARRLLALNPWQEEIHRCVMQALARVGQRSAALAQYETCRQALAEELGVEPTQETRELYDRISALATARRHNLPVQPTVFIGRGEELAEVCQLLSRPDCRLLTILGPGGIGKTRLALQAAEAKSEVFLEGVCFVPLAAVSSAEFIVSAIADALQFPLTAPQDARAQLFNYLRRKELLLVLDGFEHLVEGTALLADVLQEAPEVKLLVTSRECLDLRWEWRYEIQGLAYPADGDGAGDAEELAHYSAVQLFLKAARRARPGFSLSTCDRPAVKRICKLVEGMPLGLELAASLIKTRTCDEIAGDIEHNLGSLTTTFRDMPKRQRSLRATFDHSWRLLAPSEQSALAQLSVFRGGFGAEAANDVAGAGSDTLESLASKSLLRFAPTGRFEMHEFARQYAAERLATTSGVEGETRDRHCVYYTTFLHHLEVDLTGVSAAAAQAAIGTEIANVRTAWRWAVTRARIEEIERSLDSLSRFLLLAGLYQEGETLTQMTVDLLRTLVEKADRMAQGLRTTLGRVLAERARFLNRLGAHDEAIGVAREAMDLARAEGAVSEEASACLQWGQALWRQGAPDAAQTRLEEALGLARAASSRQVEADTLRILGNACFGRAAFAEARTHFEKALSIYHGLGDGRGEGGALNNLGTVCQALGDNTEATGYYEQALTIYRQIGDRQIGGAALHNLARVRLQQGAYAQARAYLEQALQIWREVGDRHGEGWGLLNLGCIAHDEGDYAEAQVRCEQGLRVFRDIGDRRGESNALVDLGRVLHRRGRCARAATCLEQALLICRETGDRQGECWALRCLGNLSTECGGYAEAEVNLGQALCVCQEIGDRKDEAEVQADLCLLFHQLGDDQIAMEHGRQALLIARELGDRPVERTALTRLAHAMVGVGCLAEAAEVGQRALELSMELGGHVLAAESLAALARISVAAGNLALAQTQIEETLGLLEANSLEGTDEAFRVYLTCYHVLRQSQDPRAQRILAEAHRLLRARAARIGDDELRRSFLDGVPTHREIIKEAERLSTR